MKTLLEQHNKEVEKKMSEVIQTFYKVGSGGNNVYKDNVDWNIVKDFISSLLKSQRESMVQDIQSVLAQLGGIEDEKARKIENFINEYLLK